MTRWVCPLTEPGLMVVVKGRESPSRLSLVGVMGNSEEGKASKPEKPSSAAMDHNNIHVYPDWAAMQAYYGPRLGVPPYMNSGVASPHAPPPYMWGPPQSMMPSPYGNPYAAAFYAHHAHGGIYAHPGIPVYGTTSVNMENPPMKSSEGYSDGSFGKNLKEFDRLTTMSIGINGNVKNGEHGSDHRLTTESEGEMEDSSDGSNGVATTGAFKRSKDRSRQESPSNEADGQKKSSLLKIPRVEEVSCGSEKSVDVIVTARPAPAANLSVEKSSPSNALVLLKDPTPSILIERELKKEKRKQSNRESARRSRLRKQAETGELATKVQILTAENITLKSERNKLIQSSQKLRRENATLMEKLGNAQVGRETEVNIIHNIDVRLKPIGTVNLLARVNNSDSTYTNSDADGDSYEEHNISRGAKLHQLLKASPRTDAVAAV